MASSSLLMCWPLSFAIFWATFWATFWVSAGHHQMISSTLTCIESSPDSFTCSCVSGYTGDRCQTPSSNPTGCNPNPCQNGGTCTESSPDSFTCNCVPGFSGDRCETSDSPGNEDLSITNFEYAGAFRLPYLADPRLGWAGGILAHSAAKLPLHCRIRPGAAGGRVSNPITGNAKCRG